ncbi:AhpA/YtjB family protein [Shewanella sp. 1_MG-2023]|uniref:AhpA/YtjB family protein n=1 Tax=unclassified Shewanella TaxID=196818 RepID=UPI0026E11789|nr:MULTISPECIES: AhpA/YtjB family protein [unclassified Shewanella]MDO6610313.1 AhpA/YtjB family protein [Shewanella sp. 7_MG-2023]MDO6770438.1 AhpA/YtjB family protein [Shewanella sp. 2_MG-2023]MDO6794325.1 AhpA/YtjB family protein [Shewanella sp. 1_MG-2023]
MIFVKGLKKSQKISRLIQIILAIILLIGLTHLWKSSLNNGQQLLNSQTQIMARLLAQQAANGAAPAMFLQNDEQLQWLANALIDDPKVMSVNIYDAQGVRLAFAQSVSEDDFDADDKELKQLLSPYPPLIENVLQGENNLGYIEVRLNLRIFFDEIKTLYQENMKLQQTMLIVAGIIGLLLSRALSFKRADFDRRKTRAKQGRKNSNLLQNSMIENTAEDELNDTDFNNSGFNEADLNEADLNDSDLNDSGFDKNDISQDEAVKLEFKELSDIKEEQAEDTSSKNKSKTQ